MSDPEGAVTREEWKRQWKASRPHERREMMRLAQKRHRDSPKFQARHRAWERWLRRICGVYGVLLALATLVTLVITMAPLIK